jgi:hypothetical protein
MYAREEREHCSTSLDDPTTTIHMLLSQLIPGDYLYIYKISNKGFFLWLRLWFSEGTASQHSQALLGCRSVVQQACMGTPNTMLACTPHKMAGHTRIITLNFFWLIAGCPVPCPLTHHSWQTLQQISPILLFFNPLMMTMNSTIQAWEKSAPFAWCWCYW